MISQVRMPQRMALLLALYVGIVGSGSVRAANKKATFDRESLSAAIAQEVNQMLKQEAIPASPQSSDAEFLRRIYVDLVGVIPTAEEAKGFLDSKDPEKRTKLIDRLLDDSRYGKNLADGWHRRLLTDTTDARRLNKAPLIQWLTEQFNNNTPWDKLVYDILTATGKQNKNGAVTYFLGNTTIDRLTDNVTRQFLGVQLQCAQCHDHPFTEWKQEAYWGMAMFFRKVAIDNVNRAAKDGASPGISEIVLQQRNQKGKKNRNRQRVLRLPISAKRVAPKFLQGEEPKLDGAKPYRPALAQWLTAETNPYFAKAMVNRTWAHFFGRGLINPIDDLQPENEGTHPELLRKLTEGFIASGFDVKELVRAITNSEVYQRTSRAIPGNEEAEAELYSRMTIKVLNPGQLYDAFQSVVSKGRTANPQANGRRRPQNRRGNNNPREQFINFFKYDPYADRTEYTAGIPQALRLMNSREVSTFGLVNLLLRDKKKPEEVIETLYLSTLSRRPTQEEAQFLLSKVEEAQPREAYNDVLWALLNCSEFTLNH